MNANFTSARIFLARVMAWPQEGDITPSYVNIHYTFLPSGQVDGEIDPKTKKAKKLPWTGTAFQDLGKAISFTEFTFKQPQNRDYYFCTSTQTYAEKTVNTHGKAKLKAHRSAEGAFRMKSLFIDSDLIDGKADKDKGYETKEEFSAALVQFLKDTGLPRPTIIVSSGGGFHLYWTLARALTPDEWLPLSYALAEATKRHGFKCDSGCTIDAARVLRLPGTKNYKYTPPRDVTMVGNPVEYDYSVERIEKSLEPYKVTVPYTMANSLMSILPPRTPISGMSELSAGIESNTAPVTLDTMVLECGFIAEAISTGGADFQNPLWNITTLIATFTDNGRVDAHRMSSGHSSYGPGETDELYDRKLEERLTRDIGWPKCSTISASGCKSCATCPHFAENKSPLNFADKPAQPVAQLQMQGGFSQAAMSQLQPSTTAPLQVATPASSNLAPSTSRADPDLPTNYLRQLNGCILHPEQAMDGTSTWTLVSHYPMVDPWIQRDPWSLNFTTETEYGKFSQISVPTKDVGTAEMKKSLQEQGFMVPGGVKGFSVLSDFIMAWITKLQATKDAIITSVPFGWLTTGGKTKGFVYGGKLHTPNGEEIASNTDPELQRQFSPEGDKQPWIDAAAMITTQRRPALDAILASAFAAPLVRFTGHSGLLMSAYSVESGIGKSTALKIAQAVWGDPVKGVQSLSDTQNSVLNKMGELRSLPVYWDELKTEDDTKRFVDTVFRLTLGKEKSRMTSKVTQRTPGTWQTMMVAASNESLMDSIAYKTRATTAGIYRVFEYTVSPARHGSPGQIDPTVAQRVLSKLHDNYGNIGLEYASYLGSNHVAVEKDVGTMLSNVGKEVGMNADERFWIALIGCTLLGARYSNWLGYTNIDEAGLKTFLYATLKDLRAQRSVQPVDMRNVVNVVNLLARFLNENRARHTLVTNVIYRGKGKPATGLVSVLSDASRLDAVHVHIGRDDKVLRIGQAYLYDWLAQHNYPRHVFLKALEDELKAAHMSGRMGAGTQWANASEYVIEIDLTGSPLMNFIDEA